MVSDTRRQKLMSRFKVLALKPTKTPKDVAEIETLRTTLAGYVAPYAVRKALTEQTQAVRLTFEPTFRTGDRVALRTSPDVRGRFVRLSRFVDEAIVEWDDGGQDGVRFDAIKHAPETVIGGVPVAPTVCPDCGGSLTIDTGAVRFIPTPGRSTRRRQVRVAACNGCEFVREF